VLLSSQNVVENRVTKVSVVTVTQANDGQRIDNFLLTHLKGVPKSRIYKAIRRGEVRVNGGRIKQTHRLEIGQQVRIPPIQLAEKKQVMPPSQRWVTKMQAQIITQSPDVMIINKPAGVAVHAGTGIERGLIENIKASPDFSEEWELVHRLDRETSGLLVLAKQGSVLKQLHDLFRERDIQKGYFLWVSGAWRGGERVVEKPLARRTGGNGERIVAVDPSGQSALTRFIPQLVLSDRSLLWAMPETGRTHQIRVHAQAVGHPILGDRKYGNAAVNQIIQDQFSGRLFLHAASLCFGGKWAPMSVCALMDPIWEEMKVSGLKVIDREGG
jgi:23S rRNA pseudouridine955/2504/2580 synthase